MSAASGINGRFVPHLGPGSESGFSGALIFLLKREAGWYAAR